MSWYKEKQITFHLVNECGSDSLDTPDGRYCNKWYEVRLGGETILKADTFEEIVEYMGRADEFKEIEDD